MDDEKEKQMNREGVDTADQPAEGGQYRDEQTSRQPVENRTPTDTDTDELVPLFENESAEKFRTRWLAIQSKFVDDPNASVKQADDLVADVIENITRNFADRRGSLEKQWNSGGTTSTEDLRIALKQYRSFFNRLLSLES